MGGHRWKWGVTDGNGGSPMEMGGHRWKKTAAFIQYCVFVYIQKQLLISQLLCAHVGRVLLPHPIHLPAKEE